MAFDTSSLLSLVEYKRAGINILRDREKKKITTYFHALQSLNEYYAFRCACARALSASNCATFIHTQQFSNEMNLV